MKLIVLLSILFTFSAMANDEHKAEANVATHHAENKETHKDMKTASKEAYKKAKGDCLEGDHTLKGQKLQDCIVKKQSEAK